MGVPGGGGRRQKRDESTRLKGRKGDCRHIQEVTPRLWPHGKFAVAQEELAERKVEAKH